MKFKFGILLLILILTISCDKKTILETTFDCSHAISFSRTEEFRDTKNNFKINFPSNWKIDTYYNKNQSTIFAADTLKQLTDTYIIDVSWKQGKLELNPELVEKVHADDSFEVISFKFENILEKPSFWHLSKGERKNFEYHILSIYIKTSFDSYMQISTEIYGDENVEKRLCEAMSLIKTIEFI